MLLDDYSSQMNITGNNLPAYLPQPTYIRINVCWHCIMTQVQRRISRSESPLVGRYIDIVHLLKKQISILHMSNSLKNFSRTAPTFVTRRIQKTLLECRIWLSTAFDAAQTRCFGRCQGSTNAQTCFTRAALKAVAIRIPIKEHFCTRDHIDVITQQKK